MRKKMLLMVAAVAALAFVFDSCTQAPTEKVVLKNEVDTLSYSFGASVGESFMQGTLQQMGIIKDTTALSREYAVKIKTETDESKKAVLQKEMRHKIDSTYKAGQYETAEFLKGMQKGMNSRESEKGYNIGLFFGTQIANQDLKSIKKDFFEDKQDLNKSAIMAAITSAVMKKEMILPNATSYLNKAGEKLQQKAAEERKIEAEKTRAKGENFLADNKTKEGVVALESGVQYKVLKEGTGVKPTATDQVKCHYHGTLIDGTVFDSSVERGEPVVFGVNQVIPGWTEILQLMPVGSQWEVYIPYDKAYGEHGSGRIPGFSTLVFQVEVLSIEK